eukprot:Amastigsp_a175324_206.p1 type:complete len:348 gc:universal Amastigsp_a175324_206:295-1338(+)
MRALRRQTPGDHGSRPRRTSVGVRSQACLWIVTRAPRAFCIMVIFLFWGVFCGCLRTFRTPNFAPHDSAVHGPERSSVVCRQLSSGEMVEHRPASLSRVHSCGPDSSYKRDSLLINSGLQIAWHHNPALYSRVRSRLQNPHIAVIRQLRVLRVQDTRQHPPLGRIANALLLHPLDVRTSLPLAALGQQHPDAPTRGHLAACREHEVMDAEVHVAVRPQQPLEAGAALRHKLWSVVAQQSLVRDPISSARTHEHLAHCDAVIAAFKQTVDSTATLREDYVVPLRRRKQRARSQSLGRAPDARRRQSVEPLGHRRRKVRHAHMRDNAACQRERSRVRRRAALALTGCGC